MGATMPRMCKSLALCAVAISGCGASTAAPAAVTDERIVGVFSDPVFVGYISNDTTVGEKTFADYSANAPATTFISPDGSAIQWGSNTSSVPIGPPFSGADVQRRLRTRRGPVNADPAGHDHLHEWTNESAGGIEPAG